MDHGRLITLLTRRRIDLGMPQVEVAELSGVSARTVSKWESGQHVPRTPELLLWIDAVDLVLVLRQRVDVGRRDVGG
jgi:transcriptional regulator with XRE-family HTH domain